MDIRKYSFSQRTINEWNELSSDCVTATSLNIFKNKIDTYLRRAGYTYMKNVGLLNSFLVHLPSGPLPWLLLLVKSCTSLRDTYCYIYGVKLWNGLCNALGNCKNILTFKTCTQNLHLIEVKGIFYSDTCINMFTVLACGTFMH